MTVNAAHNENQPSINQKRFLGNQLTGHSEPTDEQPNVPSPDHNPFTSVHAIADSSVLILPRGPDPDEQNQDIEDHDRHKTLSVDGHLPFVCVLPPRSGAIAHGELESHGVNFEDTKEETQFNRLQLWFVRENENPMSTLKSYYPNCFMQSDTDSILAANIHSVIRFTEAILTYVNKKSKCDVTHEKMWRIIRHTSNSQL